MSARRLLGIALLIGAIGCVLIWATPSWFPVAAATQADRQDTLYLVLMFISSFIFAIVVTFLGYSMWKFRRRQDDFSEGPPIHGHTALEIFWTAVPTLIVIVLSIYGAVVLYKNEQVSSNKLVVDVTGRQFAWSFHYPQQKLDSGVLMLPLGRETEFRIHGVAGDVIHSFYVPQFRVKQDAVPGITTRTYATPTRIGTYSLICTELCGIGHAQMRAVVRVVSNVDFEKWVSQQRQAGSTQNPGEAAFNAQGCGGCHTFQPAGATGKVGPDLDDLQAAAQKYGKGETPEQYVHDSIVDPSKVVVPSYSDIMPKDFGQKLSDQQLSALVTYLLKGAQ